MIEDIIAGKINKKDYQDKYKISKQLVSSSLKKYLNNIEKESDYQRTIHFIAKSNTSIVKLDFSKIKKEIKNAFIYVNKSHVMDSFYIKNITIRDFLNELIEFIEKNRTIDISKFLKIKNMTVEEAASNEFINLLTNPNSEYNLIKTKLSLNTFVTSVLNDYNKAMPLYKLFKYFNKFGLDNKKIKVFLFNNRLDFFLFENRNNNFKKFIEDITPSEQKLYKKCIKEIKDNDISNEIVELYLNNKNKKNFLSLKSIYHYFDYHIGEDRVLNEILLLQKVKDFLLSKGSIKEKTITELLDRKDIKKFLFKDCIQTKEGFYEELRRSGDMNIIQEFIEFSGDYCKNNNFHHIDSEILWKNFNKKTNIEINFHNLKQLLVNNSEDFESGKNNTVIYKKYDEVDIAKEFTQIEIAEDILLNEKGIPLSIKEIMKQFESRGRTISSSLNLRTQVLDKSVNIEKYAFGWIHIKNKNEIKKNIDALNKLSYDELILKSKEYYNVDTKATLKDRIGCVRSYLSILKNDNNAVEKLASLLGKDLPEILKQ